MYVTLQSTTLTVAITRKLSHNLLTLSAIPTHQPTATKLPSQLPEMSPWGFLGSGRMPILVATACGRAPKTRAPVSFLPYTSQLPAPVVCDKFSSERCSTDIKTCCVEGCLAQHCLVKTNSTLLPGRLQGPILVFFHPLTVFFQGAQKLCVRTI